MFDKKAWSKEYWRKNKDKLIAKKREWRRKNPDKLRAENQRAFARKHQWYLDHIQEKKLYDKERRNRLRFGGNYYKALERDNHRCVKCGATNQLLVHHIDGNGRYSRHPNNDITNLQTLCQNCHTVLHQTISAWSEKYPTCRNCSKTDRPHYARGYCQQCYWLCIAKPKKS